MLTAIPPMLDDVVLRYRILYTNSKIGIGNLYIPYTVYTNIQ